MDLGLKYMLSKIIVFVFNLFKLTYNHLTWLFN